MLGLILLTIAVSLDSFGIGITYGIRRIRIPFISLLVIMLISGVMVIAAMTMGTVIRLLLLQKYAEMIGGIILVLIGLFALYPVFYSNTNPPSKEGIEPEKMEIAALLFTILKNPDQADLDNSRTISGKEAFLLGFVLALDAFGAGIGAALLDYSSF